MHQTRAQTTKKIPIPRKGTKYVARALSHRTNSIPVVIAVRDMLKFARTSKEVKEMVKQKLLKINGRDVQDIKESIKLLNIFQAGKSYILTLTKTGKFSLEETRLKDRICRIINKKMLSKGKVQLNLHDGSNIISNEKVTVGDTLYLDLQNKITKHVPLEKSKECIITSGKYIGHKGKIDSVKNKIVILKLNEKEDKIEIDKSKLIII